MTAIHKARSKNLYTHDFATYFLLKNSAYRNFYYDSNLLYKIWLTFICKYSYVLLFIKLLLVKSWMYWLLDPTVGWKFFNYESRPPCGSCKNCSSPKGCNQFHPLPCYNRKDPGHLNFSLENHFSPLLAHKNLPLFKFFHPVYLIILDCRMDTLDIEK